MCFRTCHAVRSEVQVRISTATIPTGISLNLNRAPLLIFLTYFVIPGASPLVAFVVPGAAPRPSCRDFCVHWRRVVAEDGPLFAVVLGLFCAAVILREVTTVRFMVGGNVGWNVNYIVWAEGKHFYNGDWLFFAHDGNQMNVLEVNQTDYESYNIPTISFTILLLVLEGIWFRLM